MPTAVLVAVSTCWQLCIDMPTAVHSQGLWRLMGQGTGRGHNVGGEARFRLAKQQMTVVR
eukprot:1157214-Pelagomonas_calceolata.AAC.6